ncbi:MAG: hypothetical protein VKP62_08910 [Candidatus Sericytochromatia bacterium]|nr:hypothetical protein [Candidatus Sericytochromatia bacterium]
MSVTACAPELPNASAPPLSATDFNDDDREPTGVPRPAISPGTPPSPEVTSNPFDSLVEDVITPTRFTPKVNTIFDSLPANGTPETSIDLYQTKGELEVREVRLLLEGASFHFARVMVGSVIGDGQLDIGTPPKMSLPAQITVTETDQSTFAVAAVKAQNLVATVYVADIRLKMNDGHLSVVSVSNFARGNDRNGQRLTEASARITQRLYPGYLRLPAQPGRMRMRTLVYSEADPGTGQEALRIFRKTLTITG